jgi:hypothetical protein
VTQKPDYIDLQEFSRRQQDRLGGRIFSGGFSDLFVRNLKSRFQRHSLSDMPDMPGMCAILEFIDKLDLEKIEMVFTCVRLAAQEARKPPRQLTADDHYWISELACHLAVCCLDREDWQRHATRQVAERRSRHGAFLRIPTASALVAGVGAAGLMGIPLGVGTGDPGPGFESLIDLSDFRAASTDVVEEALGLLYDRITQDDPALRRLNPALPLDDEQRGVIRNWFADHRNESRFCGLYIRLPLPLESLNEDQAYRLAVAINAFVLVGADKDREELLLEDVGMTVGQLQARLRELFRMMPMRRAQSGDPVAVGPVYDFDVFLSHASEDKALVVEPLAIALKGEGKRVWFDKWCLLPGDSLYDRIGKGLKKSRFGIVILSPAYLDKEWSWCQEELKALVNMQTQRKATCIVPVWHQVTKPMIDDKAPMLGDKVAVVFSDDIARVTQEILRTLDSDLIRTSDP